jgi:hypothetical protein
MIFLGALVERHVSDELGRYQFHPNLYLVGGYDDPLERNRSFFLGGGIRWNDDNIKSLLGLAGGLR